MLKPYSEDSKVSEVMSSPLIHVSSDQSAADVIDIMANKEIRKLPVIENENVIGIITSTDIVKLLAVSTETDVRDMYFHSVSKIFTNYSPYN